MFYARKSGYLQDYYATNFNNKKDKMRPLFDRIPTEPIRQFTNNNNGKKLSTECRKNKFDFKITQ